MSKSISCPHCQRRLLLEDRNQGKQVRCPSCQGTFLPSLVAEPAILDALPAEVSRPRPTPPAPSKALVVLGVVVGIGGFLLFAAVAALALWLVPREASRHDPRVEDEEERRRELREAFHNPERPRGERTEELAGLFRDLGAALQAEDVSRLTAFFDLERMADEMASLEELPRWMLQDRNAFVRGMRNGIAPGLVHNANMRWRSSEIKNIKELRDGEVVVIVRHRDSAGNWLKLRWWLTDRSGRWKIYDFEDLDINIRISNLIGGLVGAEMVGPGGGLERLKQITRATTVVREALFTLGKQNTDEAERLLRGVANVSLPDKFEAVRLIAYGMIRLQRGQFREALDQFDQAAARHADMPVLDLLRGIAFRGLGQWQKALVRLEAYRGLLGDEALVSQQMGDVLRGLNRFQEAAVAYRKALDDNPKDEDAFLGLLQSLTEDDQRDDVPRRFAQLDRSHENFLTMAEECAKNKDATGIDQLAQAMRQIDGKFAAVDFYYALARVWQGKPDVAVRFFQDALAREKEEDKRKEYPRRFLQEMAREGYALRAYPAVPDARAAFRLLASGLKESNLTLDLKALIEVHAKKHSGDPLLGLYQGELHVREGNYHLAEKTFALALARRPDPESVADFRASRVLARYNLGKALSAYREIGPREQTFAQLAPLLFHDQDEDTLRTLLDEHGKNHPGSADLLWYRCRFTIRQGKTAEGIPLLKTLLARPQTEEQRKGRIADFLRDMVEAGKPAEAYRAVPEVRGAFEMVAEELVDDDPRDRLPLLLAAHRAQHPDDPGVAFYTGEWHAQEKAWDQAVTAFAQAWKKARPEQRPRLRSSYVHALYRCGRWDRAYRDIGPQQETFQQLVNLLAGDRKGAELLRLVAAHRVHGADTPALDLAEARALALLGKSRQAVKRFQRAYLLETAPHVRRSYQYQLIDVLAHTQGARSAYQAAAEKNLAFAILAGRLLHEAKSGEVLALMQEHAENDPDDPALSLQMGELYLRRGDLHQAEQIFARAVARSTPRDRWQARHGLIRTRVRRGKAAATYQELGPGRETFAEMANVCVSEQSPRQLEALLAVHRKADPQDDNLPAWEVERRWLDRDHAGVVTLLTEHRDSLLMLVRWRWKFEGYLVRSQVRLKQGALAVQEAKRLVKGRRSDPLLLVLAYAAQGNVEQAIAVLAGQGPSRHLEHYYEDEDLGPLLRSEAFRPFRERFPEPKKDNKEPHG